jgi:hypothetical protein
MTFWSVTKSISRPLKAAPSSRGREVEYASKSAWLLSLNHQEGAASTR